ncbi:MAG: hypothetical protein ACRDXB_16415, partial [Actinomycetes bacterium]
MTIYRRHRTRRRAESVVSAIVEAIVHVLFDFGYALILAVPVMLLTDFLAGHGSPLAPLSYWQSWWAAFLLAWIIDGAGTIRRAVGN